MTDTPVLRTSRLTLRQPVEADFAAYAGFYGSEASAPIGGPKSRAEAWRLFAADLGHWHLRGFGWWTVLETASGDVVGAVGLHHPPHHADLEIGWNVYRPGKGIGTEAAEAALAWAVDTMRPARLVSYIDRGNAASIALATKLGATCLPEPAAHDPGCAVYEHDLGRDAR